MKTKGKIFNHDTINAVGNVINHSMGDAAPNIEQDDLGDCASEKELAQLLGVFKYPGRVLGTTNPNDIIQLHPDLRGGWSWITDHYDRIGLSYTKEVIWNDDFDLIGKFPDHELSVFFFGLKAHSARPNKKWFDLVERINSKNNFIKFCQNLSIDIPETSCFEDVSEFCGCDGIKFPVYLKISTSVSGLGVVRCRDEDELLKEIFLIKPGIGFQLQEEVKAKAFINIQYAINSEHLKRVVITEQILEGCQHSGNRFPAGYDDVWEITDPIAMKLQQEGIEGYFAFDVAVTYEGKYLLIECNPRYNGSTYPTNIAKKLGIESWVAKNFETTKTFDELNLGELEYNSAEKSGVVVVNWGCISDGKMGVLIAGNLSEQSEIEEELKRII